MDQDLSTCNGLFEIVDDKCDMGDRLHEVGERSVLFEPDPLDAERAFSNPDTCTLYFSRYSSTSRDSRVGIPMWYYIKSFFIDGPPGLSLIHI